MSPIRFAIAVLIGTVAGLPAPPAVAAVRILEGTEPPPSNLPAQVAPPAPTPAEVATPPQQPPPAKGAAVPDVPAPPPPPVSTVPSVPNTAPNLTDLAKVTPANEAQLSVEMLPSQTVSVGSFVSFKVTSKKPGYVVLMDVDAAGHLNQIYPNTPALARTNRVNANYIKPGRPLVIPLATDPYAGVRYVVSPPNGEAMIVGILSASPVQIVDLPDIPAEILGKPDMILAYLSKRTNELRVPDQDNRLRQAQWSFDAKPYTIQ
ncbi:DUF4384 domain-containing protein [Bradyrhizobium jicamae]|uniref:DUF4384 domain-containing protein n=1 Tax=Bradyrhizobium jicamae TaxID=280332 RepID=A0ABS5FVA2_9BRAD|nr:DUF4384 domain-containing protein [Bradyrhizobium jicamae]MBR0800698.1 DUF4384 domain-containing protein [Bradyrhizobium jicamae]MBR0936633.1 DUF4384 domain-containing protein [Bradyrhizobium jicamae]